jgi:CHRD domain
VKTLYAVLGILAVALATVGIAAADTPLLTTFVAPLDTAQEVPGCPPAGNEARGLATFNVVDEAAGTVEFKIVANNLPGNIVAAHIHRAPPGVAGPVVQPTPPTPGEENGVVAEGTFTNPALVAAIQADPQAYYVNVHTNVCPAGAIRGQLGEHGPPGANE